MTIKKKKYTEFEEEKIRIYKELPHSKKTNNPIKTWTKDLQTPDQKKHSHGKQAYEKMIHLIYHQRNANESNDETSLYTY